MIINYDLTLSKTKDHLLKYLDIDEVVFQSACNFNFEDYTVTSQRLYRRHDIPKRNRKRGKRIVWEAEKNLGNIYKALARRLSLFFQYKLTGFPHECSFGYIQGRNIRENARCHIGAKLLLKTDIREFFPSIKKNRIKKKFIELGVLPEISALLADFLTIGDTLPLGLATSPIISNAICFELDKKLKILGDDCASIYSRYADDITFSSSKELPTTEEVTAIIEAYDFTVAKDKTRFSKRGQNHYVTGLSITDPKTPHVPRTMKKKLRQELYFANKYGLYEHIDRLGLTYEDEPQRYINHLDGMVKYVAFHEENLAEKIVPLWSKILSKGNSQPSFKPKNQGSPGFYFYIDETDFKWKEKKYLALGMSVTRDQESLDEKTSKILNDFLADPLSDGKISTIKKNGLHFGDATEDLRMTFIKALQQLQFNGYIVFGELISDEKYEETYLKLLQSIITRRLMAAESKFAKFNFEKNNKVSKKLLRELIDNSHEKLIASNNRHPVFKEINIVSKSDHPGISVPDFLLGVFRKYMISGESTYSPCRAEIMYERLRDKYRIILNADTKEEFSRRNPLRKLK